MTYSAPTKKSLYDRLGALTLLDERRFRARLKKARTDKALTAIEKDLLHAEKRAQSIAEHIPAISYPDALPVSQRVDDIAEAIANNQVVIIAGETGSGKTTQIPKICLELGRGRRGMIGHTQPRRIAARTVAERIADEVGQHVGDSIGYAIRFDDKVGPHTAVKIMTDGILLAEMQRDRFLNAYDTIIIDEAHERSLNIDFILGYLKRLLPKRPDLKIIITSATIDPERFAHHFADKRGKPAPIIEVSGRTYPVEIRYRPLVDTVDGKDIDIDVDEGLISAIQELMAEGPGDILCFLAGERDIRDAMETLNKANLPRVEVTPLFGRLSNAEQHRVFAPHKGRRIVLATNIAETSLTVPGIHYVVDTGLARISRYSNRTKVQRLPIEPISQASANQRSGRCGRVANGIAIRLYSEEDFQARPEFTDPEIQRTNLASVILQMALLKLGDIRNFPFIQPPEERSIRDGLQLLQELGAITEHNAADSTPRLTDIGRDIASIPVDPRLARMIIEAQRLHVLAPVTIIVAALSLQDVRERPLEKQQQADQIHARFKDRSSDLMGYLALWAYLCSLKDRLSGNQYRKRLQREFLHFMRAREWRDLVRQLVSIYEGLYWNVDTSLLWCEDIPDLTAPPNLGDGEASSHKGKDSRTQITPVSAAHSYFSDSDSIHKALLSGLLSHIGARKGDSKEYAGSRGTSFLIFPGSALTKKPPEFIMAAELVDTSRLWARGVASIDPAWVEELAPHLVKKTYFEPHWSSKRCAAMVHEKVLVYGVPVVADRLIQYGSVDEEAARDMFIRHALVEGDWTTHHSFFHENQEKLLQVRDLEEKARRRDITVDDDTLFTFYDRILPTHITSGIRFDHWWKRRRQKDPHLLDFDPDKLINPDAATVEEDQFPDVWRQGTLEFELSYHFEPGSPFDGVTVRVPLPLLATADPAAFTWQVPGLRKELVTELIRSLPKHYRRLLVPAPDYADKVLPRLIPYEGTLVEQLAAVFQTMGLHDLETQDFHPESLSPHVRLTFAAVDRRGKITDSDKDLEALQARRSGQIRSSIRKAAKNSKSKTVRSWTQETLGEIPETVDTKVDGQEVKAYPALVAGNDGLSMQAMPTKAAADAAMVKSTLTMLLNAISVGTKGMLKGLPIQQQVAVENYPHGGAEGLVNDARVASIRDLMFAHGGPVRNPDQFAELKKNVTEETPGSVRRTVTVLAPALYEYESLREELKLWDGPAIDDIKKQLDAILPPNALSTFGIERLKHLRRYVQAARLRLTDLETSPDRDADRQDVMDRLNGQLTSKLATKPASIRHSKQYKDLIWMMQELRVSLFAQKLGTAHKVSEKKISKMISAL